MDKKMRAVSREIKKGERVIDKAVKKNDKLADYDEKVRDPAIKKLHKLEKKKCTPRSR